MKIIFKIIFAAVIFSGVYMIPANVEAAAKQIYYSAGQNTSDHKTGSPTVTISGGVATFSVAQTASNMGVGDRVTYNTNQKVFISGKISQTKWTVVTVKGDTPANVSSATVNSIRHEFDSLNNAVSYYKGFQARDSNHLNTSNLVSGNYILNIPLYYDTGPEYVTGGNSAVIHITSITTGPNNYIRIYTPTNTVSEVNNNIITGQILNYASGISMGYKIGNLTGKIWNNLIYDLRGTNYGASTGIIFGNCYNQDPCSTGTGYIYNNTIINIQGGINNRSTLGLIVAKNNIVQDSNWGYGGTFSASSNNISNKNDAPGSNSQKNTTVSFINKAGKDFHLSPSDTKALNRGVSLISDPYLPVSSDIEGDPRPSGSSWDIGSDEYYVAPIGNISVGATLDGAQWSGNIIYTLTVPEVINGTAVPNVYLDKLADAN